MGTLMLWLVAVAVWPTGQAYVTPWQAQRIVDKHNQLRQMASATNMRRIDWDPELAASAQKHADLCAFRHSDHAANRFVKDRDENIWIGDGPLHDVDSAIDAWHNEVHTCQHCARDKWDRCCGHWQTVVGYNISRIGCGYAECSPLYKPAQRYSKAGNAYMLVCQYWPMKRFGHQIDFWGTIYTHVFPVYRQQTGSAGACSACSKAAPDCWRGQLCYNRRQDEPLRMQLRRTLR